MALKGAIVVDTEKCKGCGICVAFCPKNVLDIQNEKVMIKNEADCVYCGQCEQRCPDYAIYVEKIEEGGAING